MIDVILLVIHTRGDQLKALLRRSACYKPALACRVAASLQQQILAIARSPYAKAETLTRLEKSPNTPIPRIATSMSKQPILPLRLLILSRIEQGLRVRRPHQR